jgi:hypothetical protein
MLCDELRRPRSKATLSSVANCELCNKTSHTWDFAIDDGVFEVPDYRGTARLRVLAVDINSLRAANPATTT